MTKNQIKSLNSERYAEPVLLCPVAELEMSEEFKVVCELLGFHRLADLLDKPSGELVKLPGFSLHLLYEYGAFLEKNRIGHYLDAVENNPGRKKQ